MGSVENPFVWVDAVHKGVPRADFARKVSRTLKAGTHVAIFGPRGTGKSTFLNELRDAMVDAERQSPKWEMIKVDLRRAVSLSTFSGAIASALERHPARKIRRLSSSAIYWAANPFGSGEPTHCRFRAFIRHATDWR